MKRVRFVCRLCGKSFVTEVFEPGEAEAKKVPAMRLAPVICPHCRCTVVEQC